MSGSGTGIVTPYTTHRGIDFDGAADSYLRAGAFAGPAVDGPLGVFSLWFRVDGGNGTVRTIFGDNASNMLIQIDALNRFDFHMRSAVPATLVQFVTTDTYLAGSGWHNAIVGYNTAVGSQIYMDNAVPALTVNTLVPGNVDYTNASSRVGATAAGANFFNGALSEFYGNTAEVIDVGVQAFRYLWTHPNGQPANLGAVGQLVTGNQPMLYFVEVGGVMVNLGSGGAFAAVGAPALSADSPKDRWNASLRHRRRKRRRHAA